MLCVLLCHNSLRSYGHLYNNSSVGFSHLYHNISVLSKQRRLISVLIEDLLVVRKILVHQILTTRVVFTEMVKEEENGEIEGTTFLQLLVAGRALEFLVVFLLLLLMLKGW